MCAFLPRVNIDDLSVELHGRLVLLPLFHHVSQETVVDILFGMKFEVFVDYYLAAQILRI
jgi:hypothetical protein